MAETGSFPIMSSISCHLNLRLREFRASRGRRSYMCAPLQSSLNSRAKDKGSGGTRRAETKGKKEKRKKKLALDFSRQASKMFILYDRQSSRDKNHESQISLAYRCTSTCGDELPAPREREREGEGGGGGQTLQEKCEIIL